MAVGGEVGALGLDDLVRLFACDNCLAVSALGTLNVTPDFIRFMLSSMNACGLLRYSETSIWSSDTPLGLLPAASDVSVSPGLTLTVDSPLLATGAGACFSTGAGPVRASVRAWASVPACGPRAPEPACARRVPARAWELAAVRARPAGRAPERACVPRAAAP